ncbi:YdcF family protein [Rubrobacter taiwanensis]|uniref:YdcF family protein n=1 Tax=Rubrobacter taiwanensis TaxID=185139 RepID=A0A4R1BHR1_9ACTN|nr:YdcF family protein [Rubrobacter taiwanensis]TCJ16783.1 YdcF family protein [Rubrobacter taiwanensis]
MRLPGGILRELWLLFRVWRGDDVFGSPPAADAAVVLGAEVCSGGVASGTLRARALRAAELWRSGTVRAVIPTGGVGENPPSEAAVAAELLRSEGVPGEKILPEERARNTRESARLVAEIARRAGLESVLVVTDPLHCVRTVSVFKVYGMKASAAPVYESPMWRREGRRREQFVREAVGIVWYGIRSRYRP